MTATSGNLFPSSQQELLLRAALLSGKPVLDAWQAWRQQVDFEKGVDYNSLRLLPLLYHNLHKHKPEDQLMQRLKGIYRKAWSGNQLLIQKAVQVIDMLNNTGISHMVLNGVPLSLMVYKNQAARPISCIDFMVPFAHIKDTINLLSGKSWTMQQPYYLDYFLRYGTKIMLVHADQTKLGLFWHPILETEMEEIEPGFMDSALPLKVAESNTHTLCEADALVHTIFHGIRQSNESGLNWIPDAMALINQKDRPVNWDRFIRLIAIYKIGQHANKTLSYLQKSFYAPVPGDIIKVLQATGSGTRGKLIYWHDKRNGDKYPTGVLKKLMALYVNYIRRTDRKIFLSVQVGFLKHLYLFTKEKSLSVLIKNNILLGLER
jgi:hypothetical protein